MQIALKQSARANATRWQRLAAQLTRLRLCSAYCHGGVVIGGDLYQATVLRGVHKVTAGEWEPDKWVLIPLGSDMDSQALKRFEVVEGATYDWWGVSRFLVPMLPQNPHDWYCFELVRYMVTGSWANGLVTPENLLEIAATR